MTRKKKHIDLIEIDSYVIIDIRPDDQYAIGNIPGSISMPLPEHLAIKRDFRAPRGRLARLSLANACESWAALVSDLLKEEVPVLIISRDGGVRAAFARDAIMPHCRCYIYKGGYRAWRRYMTANFRKKFNFIVLNGKTGSGKTLILNRLKENGYQVLNSESLAQSSGSVFGRIGKHQQQPTQSQFENLLAICLSQFDLQQPVFTEWEPRPLGTCHLPPVLWETLRNSRHLILETPMAQRVKMLVNTYGGLNDGLAAQGIMRLAERLGAQKAQQMVNALEQKDYAAVVTDLIAYFDNAKSYSEVPFSKYLLLQASDHDELYKKITALFS